MAPYLIAVLEGDWACRDLLDAILRDAGYATVVWDATSDPCALIRRSRPDLVILDTWLRQRHDGLTVLERLWKDPATAALPVLVCDSDPGALPDPRFVPAAPRYGVVEKPFALADLLAMVAALVAGPQEIVGPQRMLAERRLGVIAATPGPAPAAVRKVGHVV